MKMNTKDDKKPINKSKEEVRNGTGKKDNSKLESIFKKTSK